LRFSCVVYRSSAPRALHSFPTRRSSDLVMARPLAGVSIAALPSVGPISKREKRVLIVFALTALAWITRMEPFGGWTGVIGVEGIDRKSTRLNSSHVKISYAVFCLKKKKK